MPAAEMEFFIDPARCIGCQSCVHACSECETHKGHSMIHLEYVDRSQSVQRAGSMKNSISAAGMGSLLSNQ